jgi:acyl carrier protein
MSVSERRQDIIAALTRLRLLDGRSDLAAGEADLNFVDLGMDSLTVLDFCMQLEDRTGLSIEPADLVGHPSLNALAALLEEKAAGQSE